MSDQTEIAVVDELVARARAAQAGYADGATQERYDRAAQAAAWAIMEPARNAEMAELAVRTTGLGNVKDKILKNHRKTLGLMRDLSKAKTCGVIEEEATTGITKIARPIGVVGAVVPSTNPVATPANNIINALKCGNAIILSPSPKGVEACTRLLGYIHAEFDKMGVSRDLVQMIPPPGTKARTQRLLETADLVIVTGSQDNVRRAYSSGTPAIGVGAGNATVIVDETADTRDAAQKIAASKTFDNATSCSSENAVIVVDSVYDEFVAALAEFGGATVSPALEPQIVERLWPGGKLNRNALAKDADVLIDTLQLHDHVDAGTRFIAVPTSGVGKSYPLSGEKLSLVLALYRASDFDSAKELAGRLLAHQGAGHSVGLHSRDDARAVGLGRDLPTCRVIVNQAHCFATGGAFNNGLPFSLSMGCGSWGGNSIDENLHWKHFLNITKVVRETDPDEPSVDQIFQDYWAEAGK
ncbi:aldehyde dehydrogenase family protein [Hoeflea sp. TYP-13]|uniref:acylating sulfoacetaldehyde dehydrogenase n=1 Tax=Hoeflea sp. TYP-13 TaxID=3230023 RepID=UPI0034C6DBDD